MLAATKASSALCQLAVNVQAKKKKKRAPVRTKNHYHYHANIPLLPSLAKRLRITDLQERHCDVSAADKQDEALGGEQHENKLVSEGAKDLETNGLQLILGVAEAQGGTCCLSWGSR